MRGELIAFGEYRLDLADERLWRGDEAVFLRPKTWLVLRALVESAGRIVTNRELLDTVWEGTAVTPNVLTNVIGELRLALDDREQPSRHIQTVHRRGYRFVAAVGPVPAAPKPAQLPKCSRRTPIFVGREAELAELRARLDRAERGARQIVFVAGEPGIGKSALVDAFAASLLGSEATVHPVVARARCIERQGASEPYLPWLDLLEQLGSGTGKSALLAALRRYAPAWLVQMPWLAESTEIAALQKSLAGSGEARMASEGSRLFEALAAPRPLVLILEDLHWSDLATLNVLRALAARSVPAQLLVIATYRPVDAVVERHPVVSIARSLRQHDQAVELALAPFAAIELHAYLEERFENADVAARLGPALEQPSGGNPLFVGALVAHLVSQEWVCRRDGAWEIRGDLDPAEIGLPDDLRQAIEAQLGKLAQNAREVLEVASVDGVEFSVDAVAAGLDCGEDRVADVCHELAAQGQLLPASETRSRRESREAARHRFPHALHRRVLYDRLAPSRRRELHRRIGEHLEKLYEREIPEVAARLLTHFDAAGDVERTIRYLEWTGVNAAARHAYDQAAQCFASAIENLDRLPASDEIRQHQAELYLAKGNAILMTNGYADAKVAEAFASAEALARGVGAHRARFRALIGLGSVELGRGNPRAAEPHAEQMTAMVANDVPELAAQAYWRAGHVHLEKGELSLARTLLERAAETKAEPGIPFVLDLRVEIDCELALTLTHLGLLGRARAVQERAIRRAEEVEMPFSYAQASALGAEQCLLRRDADAVLEWAERIRAWAERFGFPAARYMEGFYRPWAQQRSRPSLELARAMHEALNEKNALGERWRDSLHLAELADAYRRCGELGKAGDCLDAAFAHVERTDERRHEAELHRLQGELSLSRSRSSRRHEKAEASFEHALSIARRQGAALWELRAGLSLGRLLVQRSEAGRARDLVSRVYGKLTEARDAHDLRSAREFLSDLG